MSRYVVGVVGPTRKPHMMVDRWHCTGCDLQAQAAFSTEELHNTVLGYGIVLLKLRSIIGEENLYPAPSLRHVPCGGRLFTYSRTFLDKHLRYISPCEGHEHRLDEQGRCKNCDLQMTLREQRRLARIKARRSAHA